MAILLVFSWCVVGSAAPQTYPDGELGRMVKLGEEIMLNTNTHPLTKDLVGNKLTCASCHLVGDDDRTGTAPTVGNFMTTAAAFPAYSDREKTVQTLQDRNNNCFMRSMDGKRPIVGSEASIAMAAYVTWLGTEQPLQMNAKAPVGQSNVPLWLPVVKKMGELQKKATHANYLNGENLYAERCADCHGDNGEGTEDFAPVWGKDKKGGWLSYNSGAGMSKLDKGAAWVKNTMPQGEEDSLTNQEAADVMLYVNAQQRADFDLQKGLPTGKNRGYYNSKVLQEHKSVGSNFADFGLDIDKIRGDDKIK